LRHSKFRKIQWTNSDTLFEEEEKKRKEKEYRFLQEEVSILLYSQ
jgi:hypothetical protein